MINTITLNPSLDYVVNVENFKVDAVNRSNLEEIYPGGKGINVSIVLKNLGLSNKAYGFLAGFTGNEIERLIKEYGIDSEFIKLDEGFSRINIKLKSNDETEINGMGPSLTESDVENLLKKLDKMQEGDYLVLAGSIPSTLPSTIYENIMFRLKEKKINFVVDATKDLLVNVLKYKPFLIKPNHHELSEIFKVDIKTREDLIFYGNKLKEMGARNVLISMAGDGAILLCEDGNIYESTVPKGTVINSVGAGDSMVAGFIAGFIKDNNYENALKMGIATGSATAFSKELAKKEEVEELLKQLNQ